MYVGQPGVQDGVGAHVLQLEGAHGLQLGAHGPQLGAHGWSQHEFHPHGSQKESHHLLQLAKLSMLIINMAAKNTFIDCFI